MSDEQDAQVELTIDDLFNREVDEAAVEQGNKDLLLKEGTWTTVAPWRVTIVADAKDKGRVVVLMGGKVEMEGEKTQNINYRFSDERREGVDFNTKVPTGKPDGAYKNYLQASKAFETAYGRKTVNTGELTKYLRDFPHKLRITQFNGRNLVVAISAVPPAQADA